MKCPVCGSSDTKVVDTVKTYTRNVGKKEYLLKRTATGMRLKDLGELARQGGVARRRHCNNCHGDFITHEGTVQIMR